MSRLLVVEDEAHIASGLRFNLEADGHTVVLADTGEAALTTITLTPEAESRLADAGGNLRVALAALSCSE